VPLPRPVPRCYHDEETHVKESRYPTTAARAYYYYCYMVVSIYFFS
jgi:hypothetical protein